MSHEIEAAAADAVGALARRDGGARYELPLGAPCPNCATPLEGPWCYRCGQRGEDFHRSTWKLIGEAFEGLLHFDGRFWNTLPTLFRHPARLTNAYLQGHRAPQIPPFRLFLVMLVLVFFAGAFGGANSGRTNLVVRDEHGKAISKGGAAFHDLTPQERAQVGIKIQKGMSHLDVGNLEAGDWLAARMIKALSDPERFSFVLEQWAERFAFLTLPLAAMLLSLLFVFQRQFFVYDHLVFSLHSLSAVGLMFAANEVLSNVTFGISNLVLAIAAPWHLFAHMRGVYRTSVIGTLARMALLAVGSAIGALLIFLGLILTGLSGMGS
ncbi:MAG: DUF3667 domain-containing protein [Caulobacteraceae bacterium]